MSLEVKMPTVNNHLPSLLELNENEEEKVPYTPTSLESLHQLHKKLLLLERKESGTEESLDGSVISDIEGGDVKVQEKALWMLERIFRVEEHRMKYGELAQVVLIEMAQRSDSTLKSTVAKVLAVLELLLVQSSYF